MMRTRLTIILIAIVLIAVVVKGVSYHYDRQEFFRLHQQSYSLIDRLANQPPAEVKSEAWQNLVEITITAFSNVCFSPKHVDNQEMARFYSDLRGKVEQDVNVVTVLWIWERLALTGPHGKQYVERFKPQLNDALEAASE